MEFINIKESLISRVGKQVTLREKYTKKAQQSLFLHKRSRSFNSEKQGKAKNSFMPNIYEKVTNNFMKNPIKTYINPTDSYKPQQIQYNIPKVLYFPYNFIVRIITSQNSRRKF